MIDGRRTVLLARTALAASLWFGCSESKDAAPVSSSLPAATRESIDEVVSAYDIVRGSLAQDRSDVSAQGVRLADAAQAAAASAPERLRPPLEDLAGASRRLAGLEGNDLAGARSAFGDVSRALISVLSAEPSLQQGRHAYECPMAKGYKQWVQVAEEASNPYMGREMVQCGTEIAF